MARMGNGVPRLLGGARPSTPGRVLVLVKKTNCKSHRPLSAGAKPGGVRANGELFCFWSSKYKKRNRGGGYHDAHKSQATNGSWNYISK